MADANPTDRESSDPASPAGEGARTKDAALALILAEHPQRTLAEVVREQTGDSDDFTERDAVERAVRDLVGIGLLHRQRAFVLPSRIALYFARLESNRGDKRQY